MDLHHVICQLRREKLHVEHLIQILERLPAASLAASPQTHEISYTKSQLLTLFSTILKYCDRPQEDQEK
jgi:hypothetical protein